MKHYATVKDVKQDLPNILARINNLKIFVGVATMELEQIQNWCVDECVCPAHNYGWWTTPDAYREATRCHTDYLAELKYLQDILNWLPNHKGCNL